MSADSSSEVYVVGEFSGDDMCGGLDIYGVFTTKEAAEARKQSLNSRQGSYFSTEVYPIPLNTPGALEYMSDGFISHSELVGED